MKVKILSNEFFIVNSGLLKFNKLIEKAMGIVSVLGNTEVMDKFKGRAILLGFFIMFFSFIYIIGIYHIVRV